MGMSKYTFVGPVVVGKIRYTDNNICSKHGPGPGKYCSQCGIKLYRQRLYPDDSWSICGETVDLQCKSGYETLTFSGWECSESGFKDINSVTIVNTFRVTLYSELEKLKESYDDIEVKFAIFSYWV
jgi:hypothetical protein